MSHERWEEAAAAYALNSLDAEEHPEFEAHLAKCAECRTAVQEFRDVSGLLALSAPLEKAPADLGARVAARVRADVAERGRPRSLKLPWLAAAAGLVLASAGGVLALRASAATDDLQLRLAAVDSRVSAQDSLLTNLQGPEVHVVSLAADGAKPVARVFWNHVTNRYVVTAFRLPPPAPGRTYQLWAIANGKPPVSMGTFETNASGEGTAILPVGEDVVALGFIDVCALTEEPAGGSPAPTMSPLFSGGWRHTD